MSKSSDEARLKRATHDYRGPWDVIAKSLRLLAEQAQALKEGKVLMTLRVKDLVLPTFTHEDVIARKIKAYDRRKKLTLQEYVDGATELQRILKDPKIINAIVKEAYDNEVQQVLQTRVGERSLERGGKGGYRLTSHDPEQALAIQASGKRFFNRNIDELGSKWKQVWDIITSKGTVVSTGVVQGFNIQDILKIKMESSRSEFNSVYMMAEFGTGQVADPGPRRYKSRIATPSKLSPTFAALGGGDTSWWFPIGRSKMLVYGRKGILSKRNKIAHSDLSRRKKSLAISQISVHNIMRFAMGKPGPRSIAPRHIIFNARGMVLELQKAYEAAQKRIERDINDYVSKVVPGWPEGGVKLNLRPFLFPQYPKIIR